MAYLETKKENKTGKVVEALRGGIDDSEKPQTYLQKRSDGKQRNRDTEYELAEHWPQAAFLISRINKDLSVCLDAKRLLESYA